MSSSPLAMPRRPWAAVALAALGLAGYHGDSPAAQDQGKSTDLFLAQVERKIELGLMADAKRLLEARLAWSVSAGQPAAGRPILQAALAEVYCRSGQYDDAIGVALDCRRSLEGKRGQAPFVPSTPRAVPANGACPLFPVTAVLATLSHL